MSVNDPILSEVTSADERWMSRALDLARKGVGLASPNPTVGCVLVKDGQLVGQGYHQYDLKGHAEVVALAEAGEAAARGSTAYVTLEPCSHTGRTGPCADALIRAGVARVVAATADPNPAVNGQGIARLRAAGIEVEVDVLAREARELNDGFARYMRTRLPLVTLKAGLSLDGRIAPPPGTAPIGAPVMLTGEDAQAEVQRMRHSVDALITGVNTVLTDNPLLTDRTGLPRRRPLLRVVLDSAVRLRLDSKVVRTAKDDVLVFCTTPIADRHRALEALGVRVERIESGSGGARVDLKRVLERLGEMGITSAMVEAGSQVNATALTQQLVDKLTLFYAPLFLGTNGVPLVNNIETLKASLTRVSTQQVGRDFRISGYLRDPWG